MMKRQVAGRRFEGVGMLANIGGYHWAAVYISKKDKAVEYFDPMGVPPNPSLREMLDIISVRVGEQVGGSALRISISKRVHQTGGVQCGLYSLAYILKRLTGKASFLDFNDGPRITTEELDEVASTYFA
jgi:Ulp1 family protease